MSKNLCLQTNCQPTSVRHATNIITLESRFNYDEDSFRLIVSGREGFGLSANSRPVTCNEHNLSLMSHEQVPSTADIFMDENQVMSHFRESLGVNRRSA
jgi:hypothetical protein